MAEREIRRVDVLQIRIGVGIDISKVLAEARFDEFARPSLILL